MKCHECKHMVCYEGVACKDAPEPLPYTGEDEKLMRGASTVEAEHYLKATRFEEVVHFATRMGYKRIGIAFCVGLSEEARVIAEMLSLRFEVHSVCCKVCGIPKSSMDLPAIRGDPENEVCCNPLAQAKALEDAGCELNLIVGLCVGHDALFSKYSSAPVVTLVAKDRVLAHNPLGVVYSSYHRKRIKEWLEHPPDKK